MKRVDGTLFSKKLSLNACDCFIYYLLFNFSLVPAQLQPLRKTPTDSPEVFVVYFPDNDKHVRNILKFVKYLRRRKINASADLFESEKHASDRGFYYYSKLIQAEFVFVVCSPLFHASYEHENRGGGEESLREYIVFCYLNLARVPVRPSKIYFLVCVQGVKLQCGMCILHRKTIDVGGFSYTKFRTMRPFFQGLFLVYISNNNVVDTSLK